MECPKCGSELNEGETFCLTCCSYVELTAPDAPAPAAAPAPEHPIGLLLVQGRYQEALAQCQQALAATPDDGNLYGYLGDACQALGQRPQAMDAYKLALKHHVSDPAAIRAKLDQVIDALGTPAAPVAARPGVELKGGIAYTDAPPTSEPRDVTRRRLWSQIALIAGLTAVLAVVLFFALRPSHSTVILPQHAEPLPLDVRTVGR